MKKRVIDALVGRVPCAPDDLPGHEGCGLGRWLASTDLPPGLRSLPEFAALAEPHALFHAELTAALQAKAAGDEATARTRLASLLTVGPKLRAALDALSARLNGDRIDLDRRRDRRIQADRRTEALVGASRRPVVVRDVSRGGARLTGLTAADVGKRVVLAPELEAIEGEAVWASATEGGMRFTTPANPDLLRRLSGA